jgi:hypothetical protein
MQSSQTHSTSIGYVSGHRFGLTMLACALVLAAELTVVYGSVGFTPLGASHTVVATPEALTQ